MKVQFLELPDIFDNEDNRLWRKDTFFHKCFWSNLKTTHRRKKMDPKLSPSKKKTDIQTIKSLI